MATLMITYSEVLSKISEFLGTGPNPTGTVLTTCQDIAKRGYRNFLLPVDSSDGKVHQWSFLQKTGTLSTESGVEEYDLPDGFLSLESGFTHTTPHVMNPVQRSKSFIIQMKSLLTASSYPQYFAIDVGNFDEITGQKMQVTFWPPPNGTFTYYYTYNWLPPMPENNNDLFAGGQLAGEAILESCLAVAEKQEDDVIGIHFQEANRLIQSLIGQDKKANRSAFLGYMGNGKDYAIRRSAVISYENTQMIPPF